LSNKTAFAAVLGGEHAAQSKGLLGALMGGGLVSGYLRRLGYMAFRTF
jgi:hypothetical protein